MIEFSHSDARKIPHSTAAAPAQRLSFAQAYAAILFIAHGELVGIRHLLMQESRRF
jgi:hypothetical protein